MQAALITCMAPNCAEPAAEAVSGQVIRVNSALRSQTTDTLFTTILQQGFAGSAPISLSGDIQLILNTDDTKKAGRDESVDVCSLLMQLMVMNSSAQADGGSDGNENPAEQTVNGISGVVNNISGAAADAALNGLDNAASVILENDGKAAEVLRALAASKNAADMNAGQLKGDTVLAGIAEAMKNDMQQSGTAENAQAAASGAVNEAPRLSVMPGVANENLRAEDNNGSKTAGQPGALNIASSADVNADKVPTAGSAANGNSSNGNTAGDKAESRFGERVNLEQNRNDEAGAIGNPANHVFSEAGVKGETMAEKTAAVERALGRFTDDIRRLRSGNQEIRIVLEPESLGVLIISVIKTESGISAKIKSEDKEVAAIISENLQKLISSMQSKGITVEDVDVVYSQTEQNMGFTQHGFSQARDESSRGYTLPGEKNPDTDTPGSDIWQNFHSGETSSETMVDYRI